MFWDKINLNLGNFLINEPFSELSTISKIRIFGRIFTHGDRFTCFTRPSLASLNSEDELDSEDEEMVGWEERIVRDNWSAAQSKLFGKVIFFF